MYFKYPFIVSPYSTIFYGTQVMLLNSVYISLSGSSCCGEMGLAGVSTAPGWRFAFGLEQWVKGSDVASAVE